MGEEPLQAAVREHLSCEKALDLDKSWTSSCQVERVHDGAETDCRRRRQCQGNAPPYGL